jgi:AraC-like DNA-binding protein
MPELFKTDHFLGEVNWREVAQSLGSLLSEDAFFIKDREGRFMFQNRRAYEYCNASSEAETLGKRDADFFSRERAAIYEEGDRQVIQTGQPIINEIAPAPEEAGSNNLVIYSKFPVKDLGGNVIGVAGIHRLVEESATASSLLGPLFPAVRHIHKAFDEDLRIVDLARRTGLSHSQFSRRFKSVLGVTPKDYLLRVRVRHARRLLESTDRTVSEVALASGFYDHSHFSHAFRRLTGFAPLAYRNSHRSS